jgi:predicted GTPase
MLYTVFLGTNAYMCSDQSLLLSSVAVTVQSQHRALTGPTPGLTRDAVAVEWEWDGRPVRLVDTAGIRR